MGKFVVKILEKYMWRSQLYWSFQKVSTIDASWKVIQTFLKQARRTKLQGKLCYYMHVFAVNFIAGVL